MTDKKLYRLLNRMAILAIGGCIAIVIGVSQCHTSTPVSDEALEYNIDSLRRVHRALEEKKQEGKLKTLEDSIHYFEDGL